MGCLFFLVKRACSAHTNLVIGVCRQHQLVAPDTCQGCDKVAASVHRDRFQTCLLNDENTLSTHPHPHQRSSISSASKVVANQRHKFVSTF